MENELIKEIDQLEEKMRQIKIHLPNKLKIICRMLSDQSQDSIKRYVKIASEATQECEDYCTHIQVEVSHVREVTISMNFYFRVATISLHGE
jgi:hypothetical protein